MTAAEAPEAPAAPAPPRRRRRWITWAAVSAVVLAALGGGAWWLFWSTPIEGGDGGFGAAMHDIEPGEVRSVGVAMLCLDGAVEVTIEDVTVDPAGLTVSDFAVRLRPDPPAEAFGIGGGPLREIATGWSRSFTAQCADDDFAEVAFDLMRGENGPAHTEDVDIHWRAGVRSGVLTVLVQLTMCARGQVDEYCEEPPEPFDGVR